MPVKFDNEVEIGLMRDIIQILPSLSAIHSTEQTILIHVSGGETRSFFRSLKQYKDIQLLWTGWMGKSWWSYIFSFIPGQAGLIKVLNRKLVDVLYQKVGRRSFSGLYFIPNSKSDQFLEAVRTKKEHDQFEEILKDEGNYFLLMVDFDYWPGNPKADLFYRDVTLGNNLDEEIRKVLLRVE